VGFCALCALLVSVVAAQSASAISGTTAFTCSKSASVKDRFGEHCLATGTPKEYGHVAIAHDTTTEVELTTKNTSNNTTTGTIAVFKSTIGGVGVTFTATEVHGSGWMENKLDASGEHYVVAHTSSTFTGVTSSLPGCKVSTDIDPSNMGLSEVVHTEGQIATTKGQGDSGKLEPTTGTTFARFYLTGCNTAAFNGTYTVSGSLTCVPNGATVTCSHTEVTTQNTLKLNGAQKAGLEIATTLKGRANSGQSYTPLSATTVTT